MASQFEQFSLLVLQRQPTAELRSETSVGRRGEGTDGFLREAYGMLDQVAHVASFLARVAPLFLATPRRHENQLDFAAFDARDAALFGIGSDFVGAPLTPQQRDAVAARIAAFLEANMARVEALRRAAASNQTPPTHDGFLAAFVAAANASAIAKANRHAAVIAEHRASIVWLLQTRLMAASNAFRILQEQSLEIQTHREEGYLNIPKPKPQLRERGQPALVSGATSASINILSEFSATMSRATKIATSLASEQLESIVGVSAITAKRGGGGSGGPNESNEPEGWEMDDDFEEMDEPVRPTETDPTQVEGLRQRGGGDQVSSRPVGKSQYLAKRYEEEEEKEAQEFLAGISSNKRMLLERENEELLQHFEGGLDQIR
ncbi:hypothetical protein HDU98_002409 [Podochytrium sp. JEL0797]|nr:hypothetical protein HDU98_002409 [Podochytrium sp. JEL0797]